MLHGLVTAFLLFGINVYATFSLFSNYSLTISMRLHVVLNNVMGPSWIYK